MGSTNRGENRSSQEQMLLEFLHRLARFRAARRAVHVHLSALLADHRRTQHIRIALNTFEFQVRQLDGQIFVLDNADLVFVWKGTDLTAVDEAVTHLRQLFHDDPLAQEVAEDEPNRFCTWYDIEQHYDQFLAAIRRLAEDGQKRAQRLAALSGPGGSTRRAELPPLNPHRLGELVDAISRADLSNMMRRQAVCAIAADGPPMAMFHELYISIDELRAIVMPDYNIASDRWLFQHLTQVLDQRMLQLLTKNDDGAIASAFSINLNVATLLSDRFLAYDAGLRAATRGTIIFELQAVDIFSDLGTYIFARDFVRERGYRVCLDGVTDLTLPFIDRERLGLDLVKILWHPDILGSGRPERREEIRRQIAAFGRARVILCRCDSAEAVAAGRSLGINLFQGRHVDGLLGAAGTDAMRSQRRRPVAQAAPRPR